MDIIICFLNKTIPRITDLLVYITEKQKEKLDFLEEFIAYAEKKNIKRDNAGIKTSENLITTQLS